MKYFYVAASAILLTACGGSDSGDGASTGGATTSEVKLEVVQETYCGGVVPATNAELVIYDNNWQITHRFKPDASGKIVGTIPRASNANMSFIEDTNDENGRRVTVDSYAAYPVGDLGRYTVGGEVQGDCECAQIDLQVNLPQTSSWQTIDVVGGSTQTRYGYFDNVTFDDVRICRNPVEQWHEIIVKTKLSDDDRVFYAQLDEYTEGGSYTLDLIAQAEFRSLNISPYLTTAYTRQIFANGHTVDSLTNLTEYPSLVNIPSLEGTFIQTFHDETTDIDGVTATQTVWIRKEIDPNSNQTPDIVMPDTDPAASLAETFSALLQSDSMSYKVSNAGSYYAVVASLSGRLSDNTYYSEYYTGPLEGRMPENALPSDYGLTTMIENMEQFSAYMSLFSYPHFNSYAAYAEANIERSTLSWNESLSGKWSEYRSLMLRISN